MSDPIPSAELLESTHDFPGVYQIKAIGATAEDFHGRVLAAVAVELPEPDAVDHSVRSTPDGRHVSVTLHLSVETAEQVRAIYARLRELEGLAMLL